MNTNLNRIEMVATGSEALQELHSYNAKDVPTFHEDRLRTLRSAEKS